MLDVHSPGVLRSPTGLWTQSWRAPLGDRHVSPPAAVVAGSESDRAAALGFLDRRRGRSGRRPLPIGAGFGSVDGRVGVGLCSRLWFVDRIPAWRLAAGRPVRGDVRAGLHAAVVGLEKRVRVQNFRRHFHHGVQHVCEDVVHVCHTVADEVVRSAALQDRLEIRGVLRENGLLDFLHRLGRIGIEQLHGVVSHVCDGLLIHVALRSLGGIFAVKPVLSGQVTNHGC
mmetsp:Transcript_27204/g.46955  ORF Transcript_27204/g.46955 Transcript_27204/m.46955 type:complete len:227 (-) Transcript_27204:270-950(-)